MQANTPNIRVHLGESGMRTEIAIRPEGDPSANTSAAHHIIADEPGTYGGTDTGPTPVELMLSALGSCKAITARMYAVRKGWALTEVRADVVHAKVKPATGDGPAVDEISVALTFAGDLTDEQRVRLLDIAERCPVQKMLEGTTAVHSALAQRA